jgi:hypothetical protein
MSRCPCCRKDESLEPTCDYYHPDTLTTHLQGKLYGPTGEILPNAVITVEITDRNDSYVGLRTSTKTNEYGIYNFKVKAVIVIFTLLKMKIALNIYWVKCM